MVEMCPSQNCDAGRAVWMGYKICIYKQENLKYEEHQFNVGVRRPRPAAADPTEMYGFWLCPNPYVKRVIILHESEAH